VVYLEFSLCVAQKMQIYHFLIARVHAFFIRTKLPREYIGTRAKA
jgi:hypothetical protein